MYSTDNNFQFLTKRSIFLPIFFSLLKALIQVFVGFLTPMFLRHENGALNQLARYALNCAARGKIRIVKGINLFSIWFPDHDF